MGIAPQFSQELMLKGKTILILLRSIALALARYQDSTDITVIKKLFKRKNTEYYAIYSAKEFPASSFYPLLVNIFEREWKELYCDDTKWRILCQALAKYPQKQTDELFKRMTEVIAPYKYKTYSVYVLIALLTNYLNH